MSAQIAHVGISVSDIDKSIAWYSKYFGFVETKRFDKPALEIRGAVLNLGEGLLEILAPYAPLVAKSPGATLTEHLRQCGSNHFALSVDSLSACHEKMKADDVAMVSDIIGSFYFCCDPDGTLLEIKQG